VVSLVTIEHLIYVDHFLSETHRILSDDGYLYISTPNYAAPEYVARLLFLGRAFHDPLDPDSRYEFYAHVRYFTYKTLLALLKPFGLHPDSVYIALPGGSSRYQALYAASKAKALAFRHTMWVMYHLLPPRWASEPIICCAKAPGKARGRIRKVVL
jgi:SAM-dependent methyltransferase